MGTSFHLFGFEIILYNNYGLYGNYGHSSHTSHKPEHTGGYSYEKFCCLKKQMRYQQWVEEVKEFNSKPKDMTVREWCAIHDIKPPTFYDHMRRVQDYFAGQLQSIDESNQMVVSEPTFVELPPVITEPIPVTHGLASFVKLRFNLDPFDKDTLFLFCGRKATKIKGLVWEGDGFLLLYKRLEVGAFACPRTESETLSISELKEPKEIV